MIKRMRVAVAVGVIALALAAPIGAQPTYFADPSCSVRCDMLYFGGPTMTNPTTVYNLWYGTSASSTVNTLTGFFSNLTGSAYMNLGSVYGVTTTINFGGNTFLTPYLGNNLTDTQLGQIVNDAIAKSLVPSSNDAIYDIFTAPDVSEQEDQVACAFHGDVNGLKLGWIGERYANPGFGCGIATFNENLTSSTSHELFETLTDPMVDEAQVIGPPLGWYDPNNGENGDMCNQASFQTNLGGNQYYVQSIFVNDPTYVAGGFCASGMAQAVVATPEPASLVLLASGFVSVLGVGIRKRRA